MMNHKRYSLLLAVFGLLSVALPALAHHSITAEFDSSDANAAPDNGWRGRGNNGQNKKVTLTVEVVCSHSGTYSYVHSSRKSVPNNAINSAVNRSLAPS